MADKVRLEHPAVEDFLMYLEIERNSSPGTIDGYRKDLRMFLRYLGQSRGVSPEVVDLGSVKRSEIRSFLAYLRNERQNQTRTINRKLCALRSLYRFLTDNEEWDIDQSPVAAVGSLRQQKLLPVYLTLEEAEQLLESVQENSLYPTRDYAIFLMFLQCGCRFAELLSITVPDIDFTGQTVRLLGKGRKERLVPLTERTIKALKEYLEVRDPAVPTDILFLSNKRHPLQPNGLRYIFQTAVDRSLLKKKNLTPHKLRHTCFTLLMQAGVDIRTVQEIAGHSSISTTQIYTHVSQEAVRKGMDKHPLG